MSEVTKGGLWPPYLVPGEEPMNTVFGIWVKDDQYYTLCIQLWWMQGSTLLGHKVHWEGKSWAMEKALDHKETTQDLDMLPVLRQSYWNYKDYHWDVDRCVRGVPMPQEEVQYISMSPAPKSLDIFSFNCCMTALGMRWLFSPSTLSLCRMWLNYSSKARGTISVVLPTDTSGTVENKRATTNSLPLSPWLRHPLLSAQPSIVEIARMAIGRFEARYRFVLWNV